MPPASPTVARWELGLRLRQRRAQLGVHVDTITKQLGFSRNYWSAVENERRLLAEDKLDTLLSLFEFDDDERKELLALREVARQHGWWSRYSGVVDDELLRLYGLEYGAYAVRTYENLLIPGLLQTAEYAHALIGSDIVNVRQIEVEQRVEMRIRRQERLFDEDPLRLTAVVSEGALVQETGGPDVLRRQLRHIASVVEDHSDTIEVRVVPFATTAGGILGAGTFHLIEFASPRLPTLGWREVVASCAVIDKPAEVRDLSVTHTQSLQCSLDPAESLDLIRRYADQ